MGGVFTKEERVVVVFLAVSLLVGSLVLMARRIDPGRVPELVSGNAAPDTGQRAKEAKAEGPVVLNSSSETELTRLPGIGSKRAAAIVALRNELGGFSTLEELLEVRGIGPKTLERIRAAAIVGDHLDTCLFGGEPSGPDTGR